VIEDYARDSLLLSLSGLAVGLPNFWAREPTTTTEKVRVFSYIAGMLDDKAHKRRGLEILSPEAASSSLPSI